MKISNSMDQFLSVHDPEIRNKPFAAYELAVKLTKESLSYAVFDTFQNSISACGIFPRSVIEYLQGNSNDTSSEYWILRQSYGKVIMLIDDEVYTLIPEVLFQKEKAKHYLKFSHIFDENEMTCIDFIAASAAYNIYRVPAETAGFAKNVFAMYGFKHATTAFINSLIQEKPSGCCMHVHFSQNRFYALVVKNVEIKFCNSFLFKHENDILYYLLNIVEQLDLKIIDSLTLSGSINEDSSVARMLKKYFTPVVFAQIPANLSCFKEIEKISVHQYYDLFNCFQCA